MDPTELVRDAAVAAAVVKDVSTLVKPLFENLRSSGAEVTHPELRLKCPDQKMEYTAGIELKHKLLRGDLIRLKIPPPEKFRIFSLVPYQPLDDAASITRDGVVIRRKSLEPFGETFRIEMAYPLEGRRSISSLVSTSSPAENLSSGDEELERYWLHAELKTVSFLRELYRHVRVEDMDVQVDVTVRDDIKSAISPDLRFEIEMMAKMSSSDRNEQRRALAYKTRHPRPRFRGDVFQVMHDIQEVFQPSKFRRFLSLEGPYRLSDCTRGTTFADFCMPLYIPQSMLVNSSTDLTLDEPAKDGKLTYRKSDLLKKLTKLVET